MVVQSSPMTTKLYSTLASTSKVLAVGTFVGLASSTLAWSSSNYGQYVRHTPPEDTGVFGGHRPEQSHSSIPVRPLPSHDDRDDDEDHEQEPIESEVHDVIYRLSSVRDELSTVAWSYSWRKAACLPGFLFSKKCRENCLPTAVVKSYKTDLRMTITGESDVVYNGEVDRMYDTSSDASRFMGTWDQGDNRTEITYSSYLFRLNRKVKEDLRSNCVRNAEPRVGNPVFAFVTVRKSISVMGEYQLISEVEYLISPDMVYDCLTACRATSPAGVGPSVDSYRKMKSVEFNIPSTILGEVVSDSTAIATLVIPFFRRSYFH